MSSGHYDSVGLDRTIGVEFDVVAADRVEAHVDVTDRVLQPFGIVHGGVYCSVAETCASIGAALWFAEHGGADGTVVGVSNHTDFLRAVGEGTVHAVATPIHQGRLQQLWLVEMGDADGRALARGQVRLQNLPPRD